MSLDWIVRRRDICAEQVAACLQHADIPSMAIEAPRWIDSAHDWANSWLAYQRMLERPARAHVGDTSIPVAMPWDPVTVGLL